MLIADEANSAAIYQWAVILAASLAAALWDIQSRRIPNVLTLPLLAAGLLQAAMFSGWDGFKSSLFAMVILALPYILLFVFAGGGAGDAKLMGAIGAWLGLSSGIVALLAISVCAIVMALLKAAFAKRFFAVLNNIREMLVSFILFVTLQGVRKAARAALAVNHGQDTRNTGILPVNHGQDGRDTKLTMPYGPAIFAGVLIAAVYTLATN